MVNFDISHSCDSSNILKFKCVLFISSISEVTCAHWGFDWSLYRGHSFSSTLSNCRFFFLPVVANQCGMIRTMRQLAYKFRTFVNPLSSLKLPPSTTSSNSRIHSLCSLVSMCCVPQGHFPTRKHLSLSLRSPRPGRCGQWGCATQLHRDPLQVEVREPGYLGARIWWLAFSVRCWWCCGFSLSVSIVCNSLVPCPL